MKTMLYPTLLSTLLSALSGCAGADETAASNGDPSNGDVAAEETPSASDTEVELGGGVSREEQIAIIEQRIDATNQRDWNRWEALHTPDALRTAPELEEPLRGSPLATGCDRDALGGLSRLSPRAEAGLRTG